MNKSKRVNRLASVLKGMSESYVNTVMFSDKAELWAQYWMGIYLGMPTIVLIRDRDLKYEKMFLDEPLVKDIIQVGKEFNNVERSADLIKLAIEKIVKK